MHCKYCGFANGEDDHRCLRCGRRTGFAVAAPAGYSGANALSLAPVQAGDTQEFEPVNAGTQQPQLFNAMGGRRYIPFDQIQRHVTGRLNIPLTPTPAVQAPPRQVAKKSPAVRLARARTDISRFRAGGSLGAAYFEDRRAGADLLRTAGGHAYAPFHRECDGCRHDPAGIRYLRSGVRTVRRRFWRGAAVLDHVGRVFTLISMFYGLIWAIAGRKPPACAGPI